MTKFYVYVGYYEVFITTHKLSAPRFLSSWHKTADNAALRAEKDYPSANVYFDEDSLIDMGCAYVIEDYDSGSSNSSNPFYVDGIRFF